MLKYTLGLFALSIFISCGGEKAPDVDNVTDQIEVIRFDEMLMDLDTNNLAEGLKTLETAESDIFNLYFRQLIPLTRSEQHDVAKLSDFIKNTNVRKSNETIETKFNSMDDELEDIGQAISYLKHYLPTSEIPNIYTLYGDYSYQAFIFEESDGQDAVGICLDMFLGPDHNYKAIDPKSPLFSDYITDRYQRSYIPIKVLGVMIEDILGPMKGTRLLDHMIYQGKKQYILSKVFPKTSQATLLEYSKSEYQWSTQSELGIWDFFLDQELIFDTDQQKINSYINEAPRSKGMPEESPGRTGYYIGYQIVKAFMDKTDGTIENLVDNVDNDELFRLSKYKPSRQ
jgi:hypothetical protein